VISPLATAVTAVAVTRRMPACRIARDQVAADVAVEDLLGCGPMTPVG
jgi:hypothetical protein